MVVGSSGPRVGDSCRAGEGCRCDEEGLALEDAGKREYLDFFASILPKRWGKKKKVNRAERSKHGPKRKSGARGWKMELDRATVWGSWGSRGIWK